MITADRYHDISCGHRVVGHEGKCKLLHGHNYRIHFTCTAPDLDEQGRVIDFGVIKQELCVWLEENWDHKFLSWNKDTLINSLLVCATNAANGEFSYEDWDDFQKSIVVVPFNPTAENMASYLLNEIGPKQLKGTGATLIKVVIEETRKCSVSATTT